MEGPAANFQLHRRWSVRGRTASSLVHQRLPSILERLRSRTEDLGALLFRGTLCLASHESFAPSRNSGGGLVVAQWPPTYPIPLHFGNDVAPLRPPPAGLPGPGPQTLLAAADTRGRGACSPFCVAKSGYVVLPCVQLRRGVVKECLGPLRCMSCVDFSLFAFSVAVTEYAGGRSDFNADALTQIRQPVRQ